MPNIYGLGRDRLRVQVNECLRCDISKAVFDKNLKLYKHNQECTKENRIFIDLEKGWTDMRNKKVSDLIASTLSAYAPDLGKILVSAKDAKLKIGPKVKFIIMCKKCL